MVEGAQGVSVWSFLNFSSECARMYESVILTSHTLFVLGVCVCACVCRYGLSPGICISTCMHSAQDCCQPITEEICMRGVSPPPLEAARQAVPRTSFLDWHPHLLCLTALVIPLSTYGIFFSCSVHNSVKERAT